MLEIIPCACPPFPSGIGGELHGSHVEGPWSDPRFSGVIAVVIDEPLLREYTYFR